MKACTAAVLDVGANGRVTIPSAFRKAHGPSKGAKVIVVSLGDPLVIPHDGALGPICLRLQAALVGSGHDLEDLKSEALRQRAKIVAERYPTGRTSRRKPGTAPRRS